MQHHRNILGQSEYNIPPIVVHCSAGLGRTGTLIAIFNIIEGLMYSLENYKDIQEQMANNAYLCRQYPDIVNHPLRVSVFGCVRKMREQRMLMIRKQE